MRLCRFGDSRLGLVEDLTVRDVTAALDALPSYSYPFPAYDLLIANLDTVCDRVRTIADSSTSIPLNGVQLLSPVANPTKIIGAPVNYQKHLDEVRGDAQLHHDNQAHTAVIQKTGLFLKACSALVGSSEGMGLRKLDRRNDYVV